MQPGSGRRQRVPFVPPWTPPGALDRESQVQLDPERLDAYRLTPADVSQVLGRANVSAPGGTILQGRCRYIEGEAFKEGTPVLAGRWKLVVAPPVIATSTLAMSDESGPERGSQCAPGWPACSGGRHRRVPA